MSELEHWRDFWGDKSDRPNPYGSRDDIYAEGYHRGEDVANNGSVEFVPVLRPGVIVQSGFSPKIGSYVVVRPDETLFRRAEFDGYCHLYGPIMLRTGRVEAGDILSRTAGARENPGSSWGGPHLHFTVTEAPAGIYDIGFVDYNPNPVIDAALKGRFMPAPAGGEDRPLPTPPGRENMGKRDIGYFAVERPGKPTKFVTFGVSDARSLTHKEAVAHNRAAGLTDDETLFNRINVTEAGLILDGVRYSRSKFQAGTADAVLQELDDLIADLAQDAGGDDVDDGGTA